MKPLKIVAAFLVVALMSPALADYPEKPVRIIVPYGPGSADVVSRLVARQIAEQSGKVVVVENKTGAGGRIGYEYGAKSPADGYTFMMTDGTYTMLPALYRNLPWDPDNLIPVASILHMPFVAVVSANANLATLKDLVDFAKAQPGKLNYGSAGNGSANHVITEFFKRTAGVDITHIPYRGMGEAMAGLRGGSVDVILTSIAVASAQMKSGAARALMVPSVKRSALYPDVPTAAEAGLPGFLVANWYGLTAPKGVPPQVLDWMQKQVAAAVAVADVRSRFAALGLEASSGSREELDRLLREERQRWAEVIRTANIKSD